jgi:predicted phage terminase large subunit-like protein
MIDLEKEQLAATLKGSLLEFTKTFYPLLTGRDFIVSNPPGREPHVVTICRSLTQCARLQIPDQRLIINVPPGHGKSTLLSMWIAWCLASYPDSRYLYISYSKVLAAKHTETIKRIVSLAHYRYLFDIQIRHDSKAKDSWQTTHGGAVSAHGSAGSITGFDAGLPGLDRHSGALIMDDMHKSDEVHSDTIRQSVIDNYNETIMQRCRGINVPMIFIGQRLHEDDLPAYLLNGNDGHHWQSVILKSIDEAGNALYPEAFPLSMLRIREERDIYVFASQHQQDPQPAGGALFKPDWFVLLDFEPPILQTFITADTAETDKSYNDATVFSFWGIYEIETMGRKTGEHGLHWIDCAELRIEPKDLKDSFLDFWQDCMIHKVPPLLAAIEKKSTGVTLLSVIKELRGIQVRDIERTRSSGSKTARFLQCQPHVAARKISFTAGARHVDMCIKHMTRITANDTHRHDDIADTCADAIKIAIIDKTLIHNTLNKTDYNQMARSLTRQHNKVEQLRGTAYKR